MGPQLSICIIKSISLQPDQGCTWRETDASLISPRHLSQEDMNLFWEMPL